MAQRSTTIGVALLALLTLLALPAARAAPVAGPSPSGTPATTWVIHRADVVAGHAVFLAGATHEGPFALFSAPLSGGPAKILSAGLPGAEIGALAFTPSGRVVFSARHSSSGLRFLYSAPVAGGSLTLLGPTYPAVRPPMISSQLVFGLAGERVVFAVDAKVANAFELYSVPASGGPLTRLSPELPPISVIFPAPFWVTSFAINDGDGTHVAYRLSRGPLASGAGLYAVPADGSAQAALIGAAPERFDLTPDGRWAICAMDTELRAVAFDGSSDTLLATGWYIPFAVTPDSARVVYALQEDGPGGTTIFSVALEGGGAATVATDVRYASSGTFQITPDGAGVLYNDNDYTSLLLAPVLGGPARTVIAAPVSPQIRFTGDGARAIFGFGDATGQALYSYPLSGGEAVRIDDPALSAGGSMMFDGVVAGDRVIYAARAGSAVAFRLYSVPTAGGPSAPLSGDLGPDQELLFVRGAGSDGSVLFSSGSANLPSLMRWRSLYVVPADGSAAPRLIEPRAALSGSVYLPLVRR